MGSPEYFKDLDASQTPMSLHHIVQRHEPSGRMNLYVGAHLHHIQGVSPEKSQELISTLNKHVAQDKYTFTASWNDPGDMIIWDNRCALSLSLSLSPSLSRWSPAIARLFRVFFC